MWRFHVFGEDNRVITASDFERQAEKDGKVYQEGAPGYGAVAAASASRSLLVKINYVEFNSRTALA
jgi:hypothetical protein